MCWTPEITRGNLHSRGEASPPGLPHVALCGATRATEACVASTSCGIAKSCDENHSSNIKVLDLTMQKLYQIVGHCRSMFVFDTADPWPVVPAPACPSCDQESEAGHCKVVLSTNIAECEDPEDWMNFTTLPWLQKSVKPIHDDHVLPTMDVDGCGWMWMGVDKCFFF